MKNMLKNLSKIKRNVVVMDIMSSPVIGIDRDNSVHKAAKIMSENSISTLVVSEGKQILGIVTERDLTKKIVLPGKDPKKTKVSAIMTRNPVTISPGSPILSHGNLMREKRVRKLVVVNSEGEMVGVISQTDIINSMNKIYSAYKMLLWDSRFYFILFLIVTLFFLLNYLLFR